jgi:hypothetical protein
MKTIVDCIISCLLSWFIQRLLDAGLLIKFLLIHPSYHKIYLIRTSFKVRSLKISRPISSSSVHALWSGLYSSSLTCLVGTYHYHTQHSYPTWHDKIISGSISKKDHGRFMDVKFYVTRGTYTQSRPC